MFTSLHSDPFAARPNSVADGNEPHASVRVDIDGEQYTLTWPRDVVLLDALLDNDIDAPYVCRAGECGACAYTLVEGEVRLPANTTLDTTELESGIRLACQSIPISDTIAVVFD